MKGYRDQNHKTFQPFNPLTLKLLFFFALILSWSCSTRAVPEPQYLPSAGLLDIVKGFHRLAREDLYRFPIPKDATGTNIMKATLSRLEEFEKRYPGRFSDIIQFTKAAAYERLRDYDQAIALYEGVARSNGRLGAEAAKNLEALKSFQHVAQGPRPAQEPAEYLSGLEEKIAAWSELTRKYQGTAYQYLAQVEEEKGERAKVAFLEQSRQRLKEGSQLVIFSYSQLVTKHRQSKNLYRHLLDFGDFYALLAKEYGAQREPEGLSFDPETFDQLAKSALRLYTEVAQEDGIMEKIQAQGKIESLRALMEKTRRLGR